MRRSKKQSGVSDLLSDLSEEAKYSHTTTTDNLQLLQSQLLVILERQEKASMKFEELESISSKCLSLAEEGKCVATAQRILRSLHFKAFKIRQVNVKEAHAETFEWIFNDVDDPAKPQTRFKKWMRSETKNGIYWVSGKAGSGKSTLMKFLNSHRVTLSTLESWSGGERPVIASHFFWSSGNAMQKSQEGLLQSLLFQILRRCPDLIKSCCLPRWESPDLYQDDPDPWSIQELSDCFARLAEDPRTPRLFILIDGLDEYDGEHRDLVQVLQRMNGSPRIKMCVSSRPWNVFEDAFGGNTEQKLRLQDFTRDDITLYVKDQLEADDRFMKLKMQDHRYLQLEKNIVNKAEGVFLWVFLVVRALLRGLTDDNDINFLNERLDSMPAGLEDYFTKILGTIEPVYQEQTARIFQVMVHSRQSLPAVCLEFLAIEKKDPDYALHKDPPFVTPDQVGNVFIRSRKYVNARCKDLLEVHNSSSSDDGKTFTHYVDFVHRSVRDFLSEMYDFLGSRTGEHFDARVSLCKMVLAEIKTMCRISQPLTSGSLHVVLVELIYDLFYYVRMVERYRGDCEGALIDELHEVLRTYKSGSGRDVVSILPAYRYKDNEPIVALAVELELLSYVKEKLSLSKRLISKNDDWSLLDHAISVTYIGVGGTYHAYQEPEKPADVEMIRLLLSHGVPPNQKDPNSHRSTWERLLQQCHEKPTPFYLTQKRALVEIIKLFIQYGADPNIEVVSDTKPKTHWTKGRWGQPRLVKLPIPMKEILEANFTLSQVEQIYKVVEERSKFSFWKWVGWE